MQISPEGRSGGCRPAGGCADLLVQIWTGLLRLLPENGGGPCCGLVLGCAACGMVAACGSAEGELRQQEESDQGGGLAVGSGQEGKTAPCCVADWCCCAPARAGRLICKELLVVGLGRDPMKREEKGVRQQLGRGSTRRLGLDLGFGLRVRIKNRLGNRIIYKMGYWVWVVGWIRNGFRVDPNKVMGSGFDPNGFGLGK